MSNLQELVAKRATIKAEYDDLLARMRAGDEQALSRNGLLRKDELNMEINDIDAEINAARYQEQMGGMHVAQAQTHIDAFNNATLPMLMQQNNIADQELFRSVYDNAATTTAQSMAQPGYWASNPALASNIRGTVENNLTEIFKWALGSYHVELNSKNPQTPANPGTVTGNYQVPGQQQQLDPNDPRVIIPQLLQKKKEQNSASIWDEGRAAEGATR